MRSLRKGTIMENINIAQNVTALPVITDKTTLRDMLTILGLEQKQKRQGKTPTKAKLMSADGLPLAKMDGCTLYETGYVLYENSYGRHSVVWLPYCVNFTYYFNKLRDAEKEYLKETDDVPNETLVSSPWTTTVSLFGEERITQALNRGLGNADIKPEIDVADDDKEHEPEDSDYEGKWFVWDDETLGVDPLDAVIRRETREEMLAAMTDKQREVFIYYHKYNWTQQQIAEVIGISRDSVNDRLEGANKKAKTCK